MKKILLVDDERMNRIRLGTILESMGYSVTQASDGLIALTILTDNPDIKCVVTDCQMPNLDGPGLIARIRNNGSTFPIFVYSAYRSINEVAKLIDQGATAFLVYPVTEENIADYLNRYKSKMIETEN
jgi:CheY-like chemotaxis protein